MLDPALHEIATLDEVDRDGAVREAAEAAGATRAGLLRKGGLVALAGLGLGALPALGQSTPKSDVKILNYALTLEYLEAAFYQQALARGGVNGDEGVKFFAKPFYPTTLLREAVPSRS